MRSPPSPPSHSRLAAVRARPNISRFAIHHAGVTICGWIAIALIGLFAFSSLKYALFPDITFPVVIVSATQAAQTKATPATVTETESQITIPLEAALQPLEGLNKIVSSTFPGRSVASLRFKVGTSLLEDTTAVKARIAQASFPPEVALEVIPLNLNEDTVVSYALSSDQISLSALADLAETKILPPLRELAGVLRVDLLGTGASPGTDGSTSAAKAPSLGDLQNSPTLIHFDRQSALALQVVKQADANTLEVASAMESAVQTLQKTLPNVDFALATTQADYIQASTQATIDSLVGAVVIAVLVIFGFLRSWQATLITALAIPLSLLGTCIVMAIFGFNLETITLLALALVIGIIVDDAIVEVENITRHIDLGETPRQAALKATREIELTVSVSTLTIVAVFLPVAFMGGTVGQFFKPFGLTISASVLVSLLVARTLSPVLAVAWLKPSRSSAHGKATPSPPAPDALMQPFSNNGSNGGENSLVSPPVSPTVSPTISPLERSYSKLLSWSLRHRWMVVGIAIASFAAGIALIPLIPKGFIPQLDRGDFYLSYTAPLPQAPSGFDPRNPANSQQPPSPLSPPNSLSPSNPLSPPEILADPRKQILQNTLSIGEQLEDSVFQIPEVESVLTTVGAKGKPNEGRLYIKLKADRDRDTAAVQAQLRQSLPAIPDVITSVEDIQFVETGGEKPVQVALLGNDLAALNRAATAVKTAVEALPGFADVQISGADNTANKIVEINHENGQRVAYISANLANNLALGDATDQVVAIAQSLVSPGIRIDLGSDSARIGEVLGSFGRTFVLALICMLVVVFIPFGRLLEPAVVGLSLPLSVVGAVLALLVTQSDFGMVSLLGLLFLLGLLDKNALLLLDYINQLRQLGMTRTEAILKTGRARLRPILMTTASTVMGMLPIALGLGAGAELRQPMAVAIIGGMLTSTLLSLVVVPVLYSLLEDSWKTLAQKSTSGV